MKSEILPVIPGLELIEKLGTGPFSNVYKGFEKRTPHKLLIIKVLKPGSVSEKQKNYFRQKIEHLKILNDSRLLAPLAFEEIRGNEIIIRDYFDAIPLDEWLVQKPIDSLSHFLTIAINLSDMIESIHHAGIIHGGIKPHNILIQPNSLELKIVDFITPLDVRNVSHFIYDKNFIKGTLAYTSPEQTGRINHRVDFTTDIYSLGIIFYEMLTQKLPFFSFDPLELIHSHLAEDAPSVNMINPHIPLMLSKIISKLILKQPEKRFQSGSGLAADLNVILQKVKENYDPLTLDKALNVDEFLLGTKDRTHRITFVSKMVGRDTEAQTILSEYEVTSKGKFRSAFISGFSGIGKTRLIQELQRPIVQNRGYFTSGKFDVYQKNIPYSSLIQAFRNLMRTFLTESDDRVQHWKELLLEAVGQNGRVITDVVPELEILIGAQPEVKSLPPVEARNRFHDVFSRFMGVLASEENPLVLFIDDLQWCDGASFDFLSSIYANNKDHPYLFLLGAYRHNEVDPSHPLSKLIGECKSNDYPLKEIQLGALKNEHSHEMVSYILDSSLDETVSLAEFIADLTEGNPLFVSESLSYLYNENLLFFNNETHEWRWDLEKIRQSNMPSTVVTLFSAKVNRLPKPTIQLLEYCACMGNLFTPNHISFIYQKSLLDTFEILKPALSQGLLMENKDQLQFVHDKVQEASLSAIPSEKRKKIHAEIGKHLLALIPKDVHFEHLDNLFTIASHLNLGRNEILSSEESLHLSTINFHAGRKAIDALATEAANEYFKLSLELLPEKAWNEHYHFTFDVYRNLAKTELMVGQYESSEKLLNILLDNAVSDLDKAEALAEQTTSLSSIGNFIKAIEVANRGLTFFNKSLPEDPEAAEKKREQLMLEIQTQFPDVWSKLLTMPFTQERKSKIELAFYSELIPDLYMSGLVPQLYLSAVQSTQHCLSGGMDESVIYSFSIMGLYLGEQERFQEAFNYEDLAKNLSEKYPNTFGATRGMNGVVWCNMHSRSSPEEIVNYCLKSIQSGKNCGDLYNAGLSYGPLMWNLQVQCRDMKEIETYARECLHFSQKYHLSFSVGLSEAVLAGWIEPMNVAKDKISMPEKISKWEAANHIASAGSYFVLLGISHYYLGDHLNAEIYLSRVNQYLSGLTDNVLKRQWYVFRVLNALKIFELNKSGQKITINHDNYDINYYSSVDRILNYIQPLIQKLETWSELGPLLRPFLHLIYAEKERILGSLREARNLFIDALEYAKKEEYTLLEAYIYESLANIFQFEKKSIYQDYLHYALRLYEKCHAEKKVSQIYEKNPNLVFNSTLTQKTKNSDDISPNDFNTFVLPDLDVNYLMKSSMAISAEMDINILLNKIMNTVLESSGAQHGYLIIEKNNDLYVRAESHISNKQIVTIASYPLQEAKEICKAIVRYVHRTKQSLRLNNATEDKMFKENAEVQNLQLKSVFCHPLIEHSQMVGILFLENRLFDSVFNEKRIKTTTLLASQAAISLKNANLIEGMKKAEDKIKNSLKEKEILLKEIHHRVKNNLQVISSLFSLQSRYIKDKNVIELFKDSQNRVRSMAFVHEKLHKSEDMSHTDFADYIQILCSNLFKSYELSPHQVALKIDMPPVLVNIETMVPIGLIVNEIITNSLKHAFNSKVNGEIFVKFTEDKNSYYLTMKDNGSGLPEGFNIHKSQSLGLQIVSILTGQISGTITSASSKNEGTEFLLSWPKPEEQKESRYKEVSDGKV